MADQTLIGEPDAIDTSAADWECCSPLTAPPSMREAERTAALFRALSHPRRVQLINLLVRSGFPVCVCDLTAVVGLAQSTVSHHLKLLVDAGLLRRQQRGNWAYYSVDYPAMRSLAGVVSLSPAHDAKPEPSVAR